MKISSTLLAWAALAAAALTVAGCNTCTSRPPIRAIDHACLPAGPPKDDVPLYRGDLEAQYVQIATIDSYVCNSEAESYYPTDPKAPPVTPETVRLMLEDLKGKARVAGADAVIRVKMLHNLRTGFRNNPRTPFPSVEQGEWKEYFMRGVAIKYLRPPEGEPKYIPEPQLAAPPVPLRRERERVGTLPIPTLTTPQPVHPEVQAPER